MQAIVPWKSRFCIWSISFLIHHYCCPEIPLQSAVFCCRHWDTCNILQLHGSVQQWYWASRSFTLPMSLSRWFLWAHWISSFIRESLMATWHPYLSPNSITNPHNTIFRYAPLQIAETADSNAYSHYKGRHIYLKHLVHEIHQLTA